MSGNYVCLSDEQLSLVEACLESWVEGYDDATTQVIRDRTLDSPEQLLEAVSGMQNDFAVGMEALQAVRSATREPVA